MGISGGDALFFNTFSEAWQRQLPFLTCPLKFEDGKLFCRVTIGDDKRWEEKTDIQTEGQMEILSNRGARPRAGSVPLQGHAQRPRSSVSRDEEWKALVHVSRRESQ